jgi:acetyltransferase-like isoleucine patch superfamily enzyme
MAWLTDEQLIQKSFKRLGRNVKISDKAALYNTELWDVGDNVRIDDFCVVSGKVSFGRNVHIAIFCNIAGGTEGITFDDFSGVAYGCHVFSQSDDYTGKTLSNPTVPAEYKKERKEKIHIGRHCIVGANSIIFPGVVMADGCSLGAMSMLTKSTEPWTMYFGIPAKKLKSRKKDMLALEKRYLDSEK